MQEIAIPHNTKLGALRQCFHFKQDPKKAIFMRLILIQHPEPELMVWQHYEATPY